MEVVIDILSKFKLTANSENYSLECKEASNLAPKSMWETYSAFANTSGGIILLGVKENGDKSFSVTGVSSPNSVVNDILVNLENRNI